MQFTRDSHPQTEVNGEGQNFEEVDKFKYLGVSCI